jgi:hypothetical protein
MTISRGTMKRMIIKTINGMMRKSNHRYSFLNFIAAPVRLIIILFEAQRDIFAGSRGGDAGKVSGVGRF